MPAQSIFTRPCPFTGFGKKKACQISIFSTLLKGDSRPSTYANKESGEFYLIEQQVYIRLRREIRFIAADNKKVNIFLEQALL